MMAAKRLPNEREAQDGTLVATANAAALLGDADLLAGAGHYGSALSLAVLAFEESVKARTLGAIIAAAAQGRAPGFSDDYLRKIIYNSHQARHSAGFIQHVAAAYPDLYGALMLGMAGGPDETAKLQELAGLIAAANAGKQSGFYTDFDPDSGSWVSPGDVNRASFDEIRALVGEFIAESQRQLDDFASFRSAASGPTGRC